MEKRAAGYGQSKHGMQWFPAPVRQVSPPTQVRWVSQPYTAASEKENLDALC